MRVGQYTHRLFRSHADAKDLEEQADKRKPGRGPLFEWMERWMDDSRIIIYTPDIRNKHRENRSKSSR